jgi:hypothetical protein
MLLPLLYLNSAPAENVAAWINYSTSIAGHFKEQCTARGSGYGQCCSDCDSALWLTVLWICRAALLVPDDGSAAGDSELCGRVCLHRCLGTAWSPPSATR